MLYFHTISYNALHDLGSAARKAIRALKAQNALEATNSKPDKAKQARIFAAFKHHFH